MNKLELRFKPVDLQTTEENEELKVEGYVNLTEQTSELLSTHTGHRFVEKISRGAFNNAIRKAEEIDFLVEHDKQKILASTRNNSLNLVEDDKGLFMSATISPTTWGKDYYTLIKDGIIKNFSFGFRALIDDWSERADGILERTVSELELFEVSLVKNPAYTQSFVEARSTDYFTVDEVLERGENMAENKKEILEDVEEKEENAIEELSRKFDDLVGLLKGKHLLLDSIETEEIVIEEDNKEEKEEIEDVEKEENEEEERALPEDVEDDEEEKDEESLKSTILGLEMKIEKVQDMLIEVLEDKVREEEKDEEEDKKEQKEELEQEKEEKKEETKESTSDNLKKLQDTLAGLEEYDK